MFTKIEKTKNQAFVNSLLYDSVSNRCITNRSDGVWSWISNTAVDLF